MKVFSKKQPVDVFPVVVAKIEKGRQLLDLRKYLSYFRYFDKCNVFFYIILPQIFKKTRHHYY